METASEAVKVRRKWPLWVKALVVVGLVLVCAVVVVMCLLFVGDIDVPRSPVTATRGLDGAFVNDRKAAGGVSFRWTKLEAKSHSNASTGSTSSDGAKLFAKSIVVFAGGDTALDRRVAYGVFEGLQKGKQFDRVVFMPMGARLEDGQGMPDLSVRTQVEAFKETGVLTGREFSAKVQMVMSTNDTGGRNFYLDHLTPPAISFYHTGSLDCQGTVSGVESAGARHEALGRNISNSITESILKYVEATTEKTGAPGVIAPEFMPAYVATPELKFLATFHAKPGMSGSRFMLANASIWEVEGMVPGGAIVDAAEEELKGKGWVIQSLGESGRHRRLRAQSKDASEVVEIQWPEVKAGVKSACLVTYQRRMSEKEIQVGLRTLLARNPSEQDLSFYRRFWRFEQKGFEAYFTKNPPQTVAGILHMAYGAQGRKQDDQARRWLLRGDVIERIIRQAPGTPSVSGMGATFGLKTFPVLPDLSTLLDSERVDLRKDWPTKRVVRLGQAVFVVWKASETELSVQSITPVATGKAQQPYAFKVYSKKFMAGSTSALDYERGDPTGKGGVMKMQFFGGDEAKNAVMESRQVGTDEVFELEFREE